MNDLEAPAIPGPSDARLLSRQRHLVQEITASRRRDRRRFALGGAGLAVSGIAVALVVLGSGGTPSAFAAWTASPTTAVPGQLAAAKTACAARPAGPPPGLPALPTELTLADIRGPFSLLLFGTNTSTQGALLCMNGPDGTQYSIAEGTQPPLPGTGQITLNRLQAESADGQPYTVAEGSAGPGVSAATLTLSDGEHVVTTVGNGLFLAWWPGTATVTSATVTSPAGTTTQPINSPPRDSGGSSDASGSATNPGNASAPHTAAQKAELRRYCAQLKADGIHAPNGQPIGPCAMPGR